MDLAVLTGIPARSRLDRSFGLPGGAYMATVGLYLALIGLTAALCLNFELAIPMVLFAGFVVLAFALAGERAARKPEKDTRAPGWGQLALRGVDTLSGRLSANEVAAQILMLPVLILGWGLAVAAIMALT